MSHGAGHVSGSGPSPQERTPISPFSLGDLPPRVVDLPTAQQLSATPRGTHGPVFVGQPGSSPTEYVVRSLGPQSSTEYANVQGVPVGSRRPLTTTVRQASPPSATTLTTVPTQDPLRSAVYLASSPSNPTFVSPPASSNRVREVPQLASSNRVREVPQLNVSGVSSAGQAPAQSGQAVQFATPRHQQVTSSRVSTSPGFTPLFPDPHHVTTPAARLVTAPTTQAEAPALSNRPPAQEQPATNTQPSSAGAGATVAPLVRADTRLGGFDDDFGNDDETGDDDSSGGGVDGRGGEAAAPSAAAATTTTTTTTTTAATTSTGSSPERQSGAGPSPATQDVDDWRARMAEMVLGVPAGEGDLKSGGADPAPREGQVQVNISELDTSLKEIHDLVQKYEQLPGGVGWPSVGVTLSRLHVVATGRGPVVADSEASGSAGFHRVLTDITTRFAPGSHTLLVGPAGCGKTTLLKAVAGMVPMREMFFPAVSPQQRSAARGGMGGVAIGGYYTVVPSERPPSGIIAGPTTADSRAAMRTGRGQVLTRLLVGYLSGVEGQFFANQSYLGPSKGGWYTCRETLERAVLLSSVLSTVEMEEAEGKDSDGEVLGTQRLNLRYAVARRCGDFSRDRLLSHFQSQLVDMLLRYLHIPGDARHPLPPGRTPESRDAAILRSRLMQFACAVVSGKMVLLLDEATSGLSPNSATLYYGKVLSLCRVLRITTIITQDSRAVSQLHGLVDPQSGDVLRHHGQQLGVAAIMMTLCDNFALMTGAPDGTLVFNQDKRQLTSILDKVGMSLPEEQLRAAFSKSRDKSEFVPPAAVRYLHALNPPEYVSLSLPRVFQGVLLSYTGYWSGKVDNRAQASAARKMAGERGQGVSQPVVLPRGFVRASDASTAAAPAATAPASKALRNMGGETAFARQSEEESVRPAGLGDAAQLPPGVTMPVLTADDLEDSYADETEGSERDVSDPFEDGEYEVVELPGPPPAPELVDPAQVEVFTQPPGETTPGLSGEQQQSAGVLFNSTAALHINPVDSADSKLPEPANLHSAAVTPSLPLTPRLPLAPLTPIGSLPERSLQLGLYLPQFGPTIHSFVFYWSTKEYGACCKPAYRAALPSEQASSKPFTSPRGRRSLSFSVSPAPLVEGVAEEGACNRCCSAVCTANNISGAVSEQFTRAYRSSSWFGALLALLALAAMCGASVINMFDVSMYDARSLFSYFMSAVLIPFVFSMSCNALMADSFSWRWWLGYVQMTGHIDAFSVGLAGMLFDLCLAGFSSAFVVGTTLIFSDRPYGVSSVFYMGIVCLLSGLVGAGFGRLFGVLAGRGGCMCVTHRFCGVSVDPTTSTCSCCGRCGGGGGFPWCRQGGVRGGASDTHSDAHSNSGGDNGPYPGTIPCDTPNALIGGGGDINIGVSGGKATGVSGKVLLLPMLFVFTCVLLFLSGYTVQEVVMPSEVEWAMYLSPLFWAFRGMAYSHLSQEEYDTNTYSLNASQPVGQPTALGNAYLHLFAMTDYVHEGLSTSSEPPYSSIQLDNRLDESDIFLFQGGGSVDMWLGVVYLLTWAVLLMLCTACSYKLLQVTDNVDVRDEEWGAIQDDGTTRLVLGVPGYTYGSHYTNTPLVRTLERQSHDWGLASSLSRDVDEAREKRDDLVYAWHYQPPPPPAESDPWSMLGSLPSRGRSSTVAPPNLKPKIPAGPITPRSSVLSTGSRMDFDAVSPRTRSSTVAPKGLKPKRPSAQKISHARRMSTLGSSLSQGGRFADLHDAAAGSPQDVQPASAEVGSPHSAVTDVFTVEAAKPLLQSQDALSLPGDTTRAPVPLAATTSGFHTSLQPVAVQQPVIVTSDPIPVSEPEMVAAPHPTPSTTLEPARGVSPPLQVGRSAEVTTGSEVSLEPAVVAAPVAPVESVVRQPEAAVSADATSVLLEDDEEEMLLWSGAGFGTQPLQVSDLTGLGPASTAASPVNPSDFGSSPLSATAPGVPGSAADPEPLPSSTQLQGARPCTYTASPWVEASPETAVRAHTSLRPVARGVPIGVQSPPKPERKVRPAASSSSVHGLTPADLPPISEISMVDVNIKDLIRQQELLNAQARQTDSQPTVLSTEPNTPADLPGVRVSRGPPASTVFHTPSAEPSRSSRPVSVPVSSDFVPSSATGYSPQIFTSRRTPSSRRPKSQAARRVPYTPPTLGSVKRDGALDLQSINFHFSSPHPPPPPPAQPAVEMGVLSDAAATGNARGAPVRGSLRKTMSVYTPTPTDVTVLAAEVVSSDRPDGVVVCCQNFSARRSVVTKSGRTSLKSDVEGLTALWHAGEVSAVVGVSAADARCALYAVNRWLVGDNNHRRGCCTGSSQEEVKGSVLVHKTAVAHRGARSAETDEDFTVRSCVVSLDIPIPPNRTVWQILQERVRHCPPPPVSGVEIDKELISIGFRQTLLDTSVAMCELDGQLDQIVAVPGDMHDPQRLRFLVSDSVRYRLALCWFLLSNPDIIFVPDAFGMTSDGGGGWGGQSNGSMMRLLRSIAAGAPTDSAGPRPLFQKPLPSNRIAAELVRHRTVVISAEYSQLHPTTMEQLGSVSLLNRSRRVMFSGPAVSAAPTSKSGKPLTASSSGDAAQPLVSFYDYVKLLPGPSVNQAGSSALPPCINRVELVYSAIDVLLVAGNRQCAAGEFLADQFVDSPALRSLRQQAHEVVRLKQWTRAHRYNSRAPDGKEPMLGDEGDLIVEEGVESAGCCGGWWAATRFEISSLWESHVFGLWGVLLLALFAFGFGYTAERDVVDFATLYTQSTVVVLYVALSSGVFAAAAAYRAWSLRQFYRRMLCVDRGYETDSLYQHPHASSFSHQRYACGTCTWLFAEMPVFWVFLGFLSVVGAVLLTYFLDLRYPDQHYDTSALADFYPFLYFWALYALFLCALAYAGQLLGVLCSSLQRAYLCLLTLLLLSVWFSGFTTPPREMGKVTEVLHRASPFSYFYEGFMLTQYRCDVPNGAFVVPTWNGDNDEQSFFQSCPFMYDYSSSSFTGMRAGQASMPIEQFVGRLWDFQYTDMNRSWWVLLCFCGGFKLLHLLALRFWK